MLLIRRTLQIPLPTTSLVRRLSSFLTSDTGEALEAVIQDNGKHFTGQFNEHQLKASPIMRGRLMPMPTILGQMESSESGTTLHLRARPSIRTLLNIACFPAFGLFLALKFGQGDSLRILSLMAMACGPAFLIMILARLEMNRALHLFQTHLLDLSDGESTKTE